MKNRVHEFAIRKGARELRGSRRFLASLFRIALLVMALGIYWQRNHPDPGIGLIFLRERNLATANASYLLSAFGLLGSSALIAAVFQTMYGNAAGRGAQQLRKRVR